MPQMKKSSNVLTGRKCEMSPKVYCPFAAHFPIYVRSSLNETRYNTKIEMRIRIFITETLKKSDQKLKTEKKKNVNKQ